jgi:osmoprotectant transport system substrate-binding protein
MKRKGLWIRILGLLALLAVITACGNNGGTAASPAVSPEGSPDPTPTTGGTLRIGSKNFTEQFILAEMYAAALEAEGFVVNRANIGLDNEAIAHQAITNGQIDLYPEYVATALQAILQQDLPQPPVREEIYGIVQSAYAGLQPPLRVLEASGFENNQALAMRKDQAEELGIRSYSELSAQADQLVLGGPAEFFERPDGLRGLQEAYGGFNFRETRQLTPSLRYPALQDGTIDVVVAFSTDGEIAGLDLQLLEDDQQFYPPYQVAPVVREEVAAANPQIVEILNRVTAELQDPETMAGLNWQVDGPDGREPADVARAFLQERGIVQ